MNFLQSDICKELIQRNKLKIHLETGKIYYDNQNTNKSIYDFFRVQEDHTKKSIEYEFETSDNYSNYITKYFTAIKDINHDKYDMLTYKNLKYFFITLITTSLK